jgi:quercetin dioxygenase-like cupin family protein
MFDRGTPDIERVLHGAPQLIRPRFEAMRLKQEMVERGDEHETITLRKGEGLSVLLLTLEQGTSWTDHTAPAPVTVTVLEGSISFTASNRTVEAIQGDVVACDAHVPHRIEAKQDAVILVHVGPKLQVS